MQLQTNVPLSAYSTMRLGGPASYLIEVHNGAELAEVATWAATYNLPVIVIGGGSNIVWSDKGFSGLIIVNKISGYEVFEEDEQNVYITVGAGEDWDSVVARSVSAGLSGIECLSLIPGTAGATPVQNVGAYGQEIAHTLTTVQVYDTEAKNIINIPAMDCGFGYRTSRFKTTDRGRYFITAITLHLTRGNPLPPFYPALQQYFDENTITDITVAAVRDAVIAIRSRKLPDPATVANNGSFFANPIISQSKFAQLQADSELLVPSWPAKDGEVKIPAAWLIEQAGFKDFHDPATGMGTWPAQPLVLVNESATSTADLIAFRQKIIDGVHTKFDITLEQEPELLGDS